MRRRVGHTDALSLVCLCSGPEEGGSIRTFIESKGMKKVAALASAAVLGAVTIANAQEIKLPKPDTGLKVTLMKALSDRHSAREYSSRQITDSQLSTILWAACGVNRPESGKLTVPSAINAQDVLVYVIRQDGAYLYNAASHSLKQVSSKDLRAAVAGRQEFAASAPVSLLMVSDHSKFGNLQGDPATRMGLIDSGYVSQNICLVCSALGLNTVPRMTMDTETLRRELQLGDSYDLTLNNQIGYPLQ